MKYNSKINKVNLFGIAAVISTIYFLLCVLGYLPVLLPIQIKGNSMYPTYKDGDNLFYTTVTKITKLHRGQIVILNPEAILNSQDLIEQNNNKGFLIKRIIGLPGDSIMIKDGSLYVNNKRLNEVYINEQDSTINWEGGFTKDGVIYTVPDDNYFVLGDNRAHSSDSREFGFVPKHQISSIVLKN